MNRAMLTIMKKDFYGITSNRRLFSEMLILPMILTVVLPSILICSVYLLRLIRHLMVLII